MPASSIVSAVLVAATPTRLIGPNPKRTAIMFVGPSAGTLAIHTDQSVSATVGLQLANAAGNLQLTLERHGDIIKGEFWGFSAATPSIGIVETID